MARRAIDGSCDMKQTAASRRLSDGGPGTSGSASRRLALVASKDTALCRVE